VGRTPEKWRRRDSVLIAALFAFIAYVMVAVALGGLGAEWTLGAGALALLSATAAASEVAYAVRPTQDRLMRGDRIILVAVAAWLGMGVISGFVLLAQRLLG
jgi:hypothetical protein